MSSEGGDRAQRYVHGYATASQTMAVRTAEREAAFFLPLLKSGMSLLDAGCGPGTITVGLAERVALGRVVGFDIGEPEVEQATALASERGISNATFQVADATDLPFTDGEFDAVFSSAMLEHVPEREKALDEMLRVLKPGGVIGLRGGYTPASVVGPPSQTKRRVFEIYREVWRTRGGEPEFGIRQAPLLADRNVMEVNQTAFFENRKPSGDFGRRIVTPDFVAAATELGISNLDELQALSASLLEEVKDPRTYSHVAWIQVTARKPA